MEIFVDGKEEKEGEDEESYTFIVDEAVQHINDLHIKEEGRNEGQKSYIHRLKTGNMFLSLKKKCTNIVTMGIAKGAERISKKRLRGEMMIRDSILSCILCTIVYDNPVSKLPSELHGKHGACTVRVLESTCITVQYFND